MFPLHRPQPFQAQISFSKHSNAHVEERSGQHATCLEQPLASIKMCGCVLKARCQPNINVKAGHLTPFKRQHLSCGRARAAGASFKPASTQCIKPGQGPREDWPHDAMQSEGEQLRSELNAVRQKMRQAENVEVGLATCAEDLARILSGSADLVIAAQAEIDCKVHLGVEDCSPWSLLCIQTWPGCCSGRVHRAQSLFEFTAPHHSTCLCASWRC